jgi:hypothetical protein
MKAILIYALFAYGICNMIIFASGPFGIFEKWRNFAHKISDGFGELFTCPMCLSTWVGLLFSALNIIFVKDIAFTPFNIIFGVGNYIPFVLIMDMGFTSGVVWLIYQFDEMMERIGKYEYEEDEEITADIEKE